MVEIVRDEWLEDSSNRALFEGERLAHVASDLLYELVQELDITQAEVARRLGCSEANVSQVLSGERNLTLQTLGRFAWILGHRINVRMVPAVEAYNDWKVVRRGHRAGEALQAKGRKQRASGTRFVRAGDRQRIPENEDGSSGYEAANNTVALAS